MKNLMILFLSFVVHGPAAVADRADLADFVGKYKMKIEGLFNSDLLEIAIDSKARPLLLKYSGDESLGIPALFLNIESRDNQIGPKSLPLATLSIVLGSDEETHTFVYRFVVLKESSTAVRLVDSVYSINDGPNEFSSLKHTKSEVWSWSDVLEDYELLQRVQ
jgi:hypothetical protein